MRKKDPVAQQVRVTYVRRTGKIPPGTRVHHRHIRNLPTDSLLRYIDATRSLIAARACHEDWATKRLFALYDMLDAKQKVVEKRAATNHRQGS